MALNPTPTGDAIAAFVKSVAPTPGSPVTDAQLKAMWEGIIKIIYDDIKANAVVNTNDIGVVTSGLGAGGTVTATGIGTVS